MIELIKGIVTLIILIISNMIKSNQVKQEKVKELKDAIKNADTSAITSALSGM